MDDKGYIRWEYLPLPDCIYHCGMVSDRGECYLGGVGENKLFVTKLSADGKKLWDKQYLLSDSLFSIPRMLAVESKTLLLASYRNGGNEMIWIQNLTGEILKKSRIEKGIISDALWDGMKNLWLLIEDGNTILIKNAGADF